MGRLKYAPVRPQAQHVMPVAGRGTHGKKEGKREILSCSLLSCDQTGSNRAYQICKHQ